MSSELDLVYDESDLVYDESLMLQHLAQLFYESKAAPVFETSSNVGKILTDEYSRRWKIILERWWTNLNVAHSDQKKEKLPCRIVAAVNVMKGKMQVAESMKAPEHRRYHDGIVGDKISGLHLHHKSKMEKKPKNGIGVFETLEDFGTTMQTEYDLRLLYSKKVCGLDLGGCTLQTVKSFAVYEDSKKLGKCLKEGPFYGSLSMHKGCEKILSTDFGYHRFDYNNESKDMANVSS